MVLMYWRTIISSSYNTRVWQTDRQRDRQTDRQKRYNKSAPKAPNRVIFTLKTEKLCLMSRDVALVACFTHVSLYLAKTEHIIGEKSPTRHTIGILASVDDRPIKFWRLQTSSSILRPGTKFLAPETPKRQLSEAMITSMKELWSYGLPRCTRQLLTFRKMFRNSFVSLSMVIYSLLYVWSYCVVGICVSLILWNYAVAMKRRSRRDEYQTGLR